MDNGVQFERCNQCGSWVKMSKLFYGPVNPKLTPKWPEFNKLDLCGKCVDPSHKK